MYICDLNIQNVFLEIELNSDPSGKGIQFINEVLYFSETYDKFVISIKNELLRGVLYENKEHYLKIQGELEIIYNTRKYYTTTHYNFGVNIINGQRYCILKYSND